MRTVTTPTAEAINREHRLARQCAESAVAHAVRCGQLLAETKASLPRGQFDNWIEQNCEFKRATAYNYIKASKSSTALDGSALRHLFPSGRVRQVEAGSCEWAEQQLNGPFDDWDFSVSSDWRQTKLAELAGIPDEAAICLSMARDHGDFVMAICPDDELNEALTTIAPYARAERRPPVALTTTDCLLAWVELEITAISILVMLWGEMERRWRQSDEERTKAARRAVDRLLATLRDPATRERMIAKRRREAVA